MSDMAAVTMPAWIDDQRRRREAMYAIIAEWLREAKSGIVVVSPQVEALIDNLMRV